MAELRLESIEPWAPHPKAAPRTARDDAGRLQIAANTTHTCCGGWQMVYSGVKPGQGYRFEVTTTYRELAHPRDALRCMVSWGELAPAESLGHGMWDYLLPQMGVDRTIRWARTLAAPENAEDRVTVRYSFRWATEGETVWSLPQVGLATVPEPQQVVIAVVTGAADRRGACDSMQARLDFYGQLCEAACAEKPDLILLPEVAPQWRVEGHALDQALVVPGPESDLFARIAQSHRTHVVFTTFERAGDAVYNSCVLIAPSGSVVGTYHKVHLATNEALSGVRAGNTFPVFETEIGRIGFNICMDSSAAESSRMVGLNGADIALMPIMGDFRGWKVSPEAKRVGPDGRHWAFDRERWLGIMQTRAMDNQYCFAVARNEAEGSVIIDRTGEVLAYNDGDRDYIVASVAVGDQRHEQTGGNYRDVTWWQRRPHVYGAFIREDNFGSLRQD